MLATMPDGRTINLVLTYGTLSDYDLTIMLDNEVSPRIVECVNACNGVEHPVETLVEVRERAEFALKAIDEPEGRGLEWAKHNLRQILTLLPAPPPPHPITLSPDDAQNLVDLLDALASHAGDEGLGSDLAIDIESARKLLQP